MKWVGISSIFIALLLLGHGCTSSNKKKSSGGSHKTYLGFSPLPPAVNTPAQESVYQRLATDANITAHHFDNGIPWNEALVDTYPYDDHIMTDWAYRKANTPSGHKIYLAVTPINFARDSFALYRHTADDQALQPPFDGYAAAEDFGHTDVKTAYLNYCRRAIEYFDPDYFSFGIEVTLLRKNNASAWDDYMELHQYIYEQLKSEFPNLPIFTSVVGAPLLYDYEDHPAEFNAEADPALAYMNSQRAALDQVLEYSDYYALSFYPYATVYYNSPFPDDMLATLLDLSTKPIAIAETGILAEDLTISGLTLIGTETRQSDYFSELIAEMKAREGKFIINFVMQDYDQFCVDIGGCSDLARIWLKTGFYSDEGDERSVLEVWRENL